MKWKKFSQQVVMPRQKINLSSFKNELDDSFSIKTGTMVGSGLAALCYAELGSAINESGGSYTYLNWEYAKVVAFIYAWTTCLISRGAGSAATAMAFGQLPSRFTLLGAASIMIIILTCINYVSAKAATKVQNTLAIVKFIGMLIVIVGGMVRLGLGDKVGLYNLRNAFRPEDLAGLGFSQIALAFYQGFWSYDGSS
ncbi:unnamed protein product [Clavelina lepadiformis]|uniref:Amino acid permease n=1 Tax=Clavelina lepadiformis TaxID=159417 RepID=A0ABP0FXC2_CLALP